MQGGQKVKRVQKQLLYGMLLLSIIMLAACSQSNDGQTLDLPTSANASGIVSAAANTHTTKVPLIYSTNSNISGSCSVQRAGDGQLYWKITATGLPAAADGWYVVRPTAGFNNLGYFTFQTSGQGRTSSGRQPTNYSVATGTEIECYIDGPTPDMYAYTDPFPAP